MSRREQTSAASSRSRHALSAARRCFALLLLACAATPAQAAPDCASQFLVDETLANGARWRMCWEHRAREGIVLWDVHYTPAGGSELAVLNQASIAQIHVPYDDDGARYHDVSDYGLGNARMNDLTSGDCPGGALLRFNSKDVLCKRVLPRGDAHSSDGSTVYGDMLSLFSVSHVGAYNYIPEWRFFDDGTIEPGMGATGNLQRRTTGSGGPQYGWPIRTDATHGISHLHNYYWRLDFDLGGTPGNDIVEQLEFVSTDGDATRVRSITALTSEAARSIEPRRMRSWRVRDGALNNAAGNSISYQLEPLDIGHRDQGPADEPWTFNDIYFTVNKSCEKYASHNPATNGCAADLSTFVNGQSLTNADLVMWYGVSFHHIPRDEDEPRMSAHWNRFQLTPRDWHDETPLLVATPNQPPIVSDPGNQAGVEGDAVNLAIVASDPDGDPLSYVASGLPAGLGIASNGVISGTLADGSAGEYPVSVSVNDGAATRATSFNWTVTAPPTSNVLLQADFNTGADGFSYADDLFRATTAPTYAQGTRLASDGFTGGALEVRLGGRNNDDIIGMSGGFTSSFTLAAAGSVTIEMQYKLIQSPHYESDERSELLVSVDGSLLGLGSADYVARLTGDGGNGPDLSTGWRKAVLTTDSLAAGTHTLIVGAFNSKKTSANETTRALIDDVRIVSGSVSSDQLVSASFASDSQGFVYSDDSFRGTTAPGYAAGAFNATTGRDGGGGLRVTLGGLDNADINGMSGAFEVRFQLDAAMQVNVSFDYRLTQSPTYEYNERSQVLMSLDGALLAAPPADYIAQVRNGNASGWQSVTVVSDSLSAGEHVVRIGGYNNLKTYADEQTTVDIDNVSVTAY